MKFSTDCDTSEEELRQQLVRAGEQARRLARMIAAMESAASVLRDQIEEERQRLKEMVEQEAAESACEEVQERIAEMVAKKSGILASLPEPKSELKKWKALVKSLVAQERKAARGAFPGTPVFDQPTSRMNSKIYGHAVSEVGQRAFAKSLNWG